MLLGLTLLLAAPAEPTYLVERVVHVSGEVRRVSLFRDGTGVVVRRDAAGHESLKHGPVGELTMAQVEQVVREVYPQIVGFSPMNVDRQLGTIELRLAPPGLAPLVLTLPVGTAESIISGRLGAVLDGLEEQIASGKAPAEDLRAWVPERDERVEMADGSIATVLEVLSKADGGLLVRLRIGNNPASFFMDADELRSKALRRVNGDEP